MAANNPYFRTLSSSSSASSPVSSADRVPASWSTPPARRPCPGLTARPPPSRYLQSDHDYPSPQGRPPVATYSPACDQPSPPARFPQGLDSRRELLPPPHLAPSPAADRPRTAIVALSQSTPPRAWHSSPEASPRRPPPLAAVPASGLHLAPIAVEYRMTLRIKPPPGPLEARSPQTLALLEALRRPPRPDSVTKPSPAPAAAAAAAVDGDSAKAKSGDEAANGRPPWSSSASSSSGSDACQQQPPQLQPEPAYSEAAGSNAEKDRAVERVVRALAAGLGVGPKQVRSVQWRGCVDSRQGGGSSPSYH